MPIIIIVPAVILLISLIIFVSIKVLKLLISHVNSDTKRIQNSSQEKTKIKDL
jgi:hypothetical protein